MPSARCCTDTLDEMAGIPAHDTLTEAAARLPNDPASAERLVRGAVRDAPDDPYVLARAATLMFALERYDEAQAWTRHAAARAPEGFELMGTLAHVTGKLALVRGDEDTAERFLRVAFELDPELEAHVRVLAALLERLGRIDEALDVFKRAVRARPDDQQLREALARLEAGRTGEDSDSRDDAPSPDSSLPSLDEPPLVDTLLRFRRGEASVYDVRDALQRSSVLISYSGDPATGEVTLATVPDERPYAVALFSSPETLRAALGDDAPWWEVEFGELTSGWSSDTDAVIDPGSDWSVRLPAHTLRPE
jgi:tetratricopeptide (TPR) repeat protein